LTSPSQRARARSSSLLAQKYLIVSAINLINHQVLLNVANSWWGWGGGVSNMFAAMTAAIPAYFLSRYWVWEVRGRHSLRGEILPFWILSLAGLVVSTALAEAGGRYGGDGLWVALGSLAGYLIVWVTKFAILNGMFVRATRRNEQRLSEAQQVEAEAS